MGALSECMDWAQLFILDQLVEFVPKDDKVCEKIIDKVLPRLSHINSAVVLSAVKVVVKFMSNLNNQLLISGLCKKLTSPVSSLVSGENETKWVVLKNLQFVAQRYPEIFTDIKVFFIRYNDPSYVKHEKLKMIYKLCDAKNYDMVLNELNEYSYDIDTDFTEKTVRVLWQICLKISQSLDKVNTILTNILKDLCSEGVGQHFVNEIAIGFQQIMRRYPKARDYIQNVNDIINRYESITSPEAKVSMLYFCGEYSEKTPKAEEIINQFIENVVQEDLRVQLQILTSAVKMYLINQDKYQESIINLLQSTSENTDNCDLRDRAFMYWRLLDEDIELAKEVILGERPIINFKEDVLFDEDLLNALINNMGYVNSVCQTHVESLPLVKVKQQIYIASQERLKNLNAEMEEPDSPSKQSSQKKENASPSKQRSDKKEEMVEDILDLGGNSNGKSQAAPEKKNLGKPPSKESNMNDLDILGDMSQPVAPTQPKPPTATSPNDDLFEMDLLGGMPEPSQPKKVEQPSGGGMSDMFGMDLLGGNSPQKEQAAPVQIQA